MQLLVLLNNWFKKRESQLLTTCSKLFPTLGSSFTPGGGVEERKSKQWPNFCLESFLGKHPVTPNTLHSNPLAGHDPENSCWGQSLVQSSWGQPPVRCGSDSPRFVSLPAAHPSQNTSMSSAFGHLLLKPSLGSVPALASVPEAAPVLSFFFLSPFPFVTSGQNHWISATPGCPGGRRRFGWTPLCCRTRGAVGSVWSAPVLGKDWWPSWWIQELPWKLCSSFPCLLWALLWNLGAECFLYVDFLIFYFFFYFLTRLRSTGGNQ